MAHWGGIQPPSLPPPRPRCQMDHLLRWEGEEGLLSSCERVYHTVHADTALDGRDGADPWGYRAALTSPGRAAMCPMAGKLGPWNGMDWTSGSSTSLVCAAAGAPVQRTAYSAPDNWSGLPVVSVTGQASSCRHLAEGRNDLPVPSAPNRPGQFVSGGV